MLFLISLKLIFASQIVGSFSSIWDYIWFHTNWTDNICAGLLGQWSAPRMIGRLFHVPELPSTSHLKFDCSSHGDLLSTQKQRAKHHSRHLTLLEHLRRNVIGATWIPDAHTHMHVLPFIITCTCIGSYSGLKTTKTILQKSSLWTTIS